MRSAGRIPGRSTKLSKALFHLAYWRGSPLKTAGSDRGNLELSTIDWSADTKLAWGSNWGTDWTGAAGATGENLETIREDRLLSWLATLDSAAENKGWHSFKRPFIFKPFTASKWVFNSSKDWLTSEVSCFTASKSTEFGELTTWATDTDFWLHTDTWSWNFPTTAAISVSDAIMHSYIPCLNTKSTS